MNHDPNSPNTTLQVDRGNDPAVDGCLPATEFADSREEVDEYYEYGEANLAAQRRRRVVYGVVIAVAAVVAPLGSLVLAGRFSAPSLRSTPTTNTARLLPATPTPVPLTPKERRARDIAIAADLHRYAAVELPPISAEERVAEQAFANVTDSHYKDDRTSYETIRNVVVPHFSHFVALASQLHPATDVVRAMHHLMLTSARLRLMAYEQIAEGENDKDRLWRAGVRAELAESARRAALYHAQIEGLAKATHARLP